MALKTQPVEWEKSQMMDVTKHYANAIITSSSRKQECLAVNYGHHVQSTCMYALHAPTNLFFTSGNYKGYNTLA
jgi:hypothetical protein